MIEFCMRQLWAAVICLIACVVSTCADAQPARSILVLEQSDIRGPFYAEIFAGIRAAVHGQPHITMYVESLDLIRFPTPGYEESLVDHFKNKYADQPIGVIVAIGVNALRFLQRRKETLWPTVPVVFGFVPDRAETRAMLAPDMTGTFADVGIEQMIIAAQAMVQNLANIVLVGDAWKDRAVFGHWKDNIPKASQVLDVTDLSGQTMQDVQRKVASLPDRSAILYSAVYSDGEGNYYPPAHALSLIAQRANRPIIVASETFLGHGGAGGFVLLPDVIGWDAGKLAMRILDGEPPSSIPPTTGHNLKPIFDWRQLQRWNVAASQLPAGSEIRFQAPTIWEQYRWQSLTALAIIMVQSLLISALLYEHQRRRMAEVEARRRMSELAHLNRQATAGEMTAAIAHELNQPLAAIMSNAEAATCLLKTSSPDLKEIEDILVDIRRDDERASEVIRRLRSLLKRTGFEVQDIDINETLRDVFRFLSVQALIRDVKLETDLSAAPLRLRGDRVQLEQVILNLAVNAMDAVSDQPKENRHVIGRTEAVNGKSALVSIIDFGHGIAAERLAQVFDPFFTTKEQGMGIGLSIARSIVETHKGRIWAERGPGDGTTFHVSLPLALINRGEVK
jgi:signal transduction histidine kinase